MQTMYCRGVCNESIRNKGARNKGVRNKGVRDKGVRRKDSAIVSRYRRARVKCARRRRKGENSNFYLLFTINMRQAQGSALLPTEARVFRANGGTGRCLSFRKTPRGSSTCTARNTWRDGANVIVYPELVTPEH